MSLYKRATLRNLLGYLKGEKGWMPYFGNQLSKDLTSFWTTSRLLYLLLFSWMVFIKKGVDRFIDRKMTKSFPVWFIGLIVTFLSSLFVATCYP